MDSRRQLISSGSPFEPRVGTSLRTTTGSLARWVGLACIVAAVGCAIPAARETESAAGIAARAHPTATYGDAHVHLSHGPPEELDSLFARGVTVVRDCGGDLSELRRWRQEIAAGTRRGPRLLLAGPVLDGAKPGAPHRLTVTTVADAEAAVDSLATAGVDFIKTHNAIPAPAFFAVLRRARMRDLRVAAHLPRGVPAWVAADSGVGSIEHAAESILTSPIYAGLATDAAEAVRWWRSAAGDSAIARLAASGVTVVPTLVRYDAAIVAGATPEIRAARAALLPELLHLVGRLHRAGVPLLVGSDLVGLPEAGPRATGPERERALLARAGLPAAAIERAGSAEVLVRWLHGGRER